MNNKKLRTIRALNILNSAPLENGEVKLSEEDVKAIRKALQFTNTITRNEHLMKYIADYFHPGWWDKFVESELFK